jgi:hypothetical protein
VYACLYCVRMISINRIHNPFSAHPMNRGSFFDMAATASKRPPLFCCAPPPYTHVIHFCPSTCFQHTYMHICYARVGVTEWCVVEHFVCSRARSTDVRLPAYATHMLKHLQCVRPRTSSAHTHTPLDRKKSGSQGWQAPPARRRPHLTHAGALCLCLCGCIHNRHPHKTQQLLAILVVLLGHLQRGERAVVWEQSTCRVMP